MDAVFKLLHVEVARKTTDGYEKKKMRRKKKFQIKSNKMRQNFGKIKFSKINFLLIKK